MDTGAKRSRKVDDGEDGNADGEASSSAVMLVVACVVENRARETVVAVARNWRCVEIFT
jgi:hypothetical protein